MTVAELIPHIQRYCRNARCINVGEGRRATATIIILAEGIEVRVSCFSYRGRALATWSDLRRTNFKALADAIKAARKDLLNELHYSRVYAPHLAINEKPH
jgi:hypothetical protein